MPKATDSRDFINPPPRAAVQVLPVSPPKSGLPPNTPTNTGGGSCGMNTLVLIVLVFLVAQPYFPKSCSNPISYVWPTVSSAPFKTDKLTVTIVYEAEDKSGYTMDQKEILNSTPLEDAIEKAGGRWRRLDKDQKFDSTADPVWSASLEAWKSLGNGKLPYILIANGGKGYHGPATTKADLLKHVEDCK